MERWHMSFVTVHDRYTQAEIDSYYEQGFWGQLGMFQELERQVELRGDKVFITDDTSQYTYREVYEQAVKIAAALRELGVEKQDSVAIQMPSWAEFAPLAMAVNRLGALIVPIQRIYRNDEVAHIVRTAGVKGAFTLTEYRGFNHATMFRDFLDSEPSLEHVITLRGVGPAGTRTLEGLT